MWRAFLLLVIVIVVAFSAPRESEGMTMAMTASREDLLALFVVVSIGEQVPGQRLPKAWDGAQSPKRLIAMCLNVIDCR